MLSELLRAQPARARHVPIPQDLAAGRRQHEPRLALDLVAVGHAPVAVDGHRIGQLPPQAAEERRQRRRRRLDRSLVDGGQRRQLRARGRGLVAVEPPQLPGQAGDLPVPGGEEQHQPRRAPRAQRDRAAARPRQAHRDGWTDPRDRIVAAFVGLCVIADAGSVVSDGDRSVGNDRAAGVGNPPVNSSASALGRCRDRTA